MLCLHLVFGFVVFCIGRIIVYPTRVFVSTAVLLRIVF